MSPTSLVRERRREARKLARLVHGPHHRIGTVCGTLLVILGITLAGSLMVAAIVALWRFIR